MNNIPCPVERSIAVHNSPNNPNMQKKQNKTKKN